MPETQLTKWCGTCSQLRSVDEFNRRRRSKDGLQTLCRQCSNARSRRYYAENQAEHAKAVTERNRRWKVELHRRVLTYLAVHPCVDCGCTDVRVLEFDHLGDKEFGIAQMIGSANSWARIVREIAKCNVRCANCHRIRSYEVRPSYRSVAHDRMTSEPDVSRIG